MYLLFLLVIAVILTVIAMIYVALYVIMQILMVLWPLIALGVLVGAIWLSFQIVVAVRDAQDRNRLQKEAGRLLAKEAQHAKNQRARHIATLEAIEHRTASQNRSLKRARERQKRTS